MEAGDYSDAGTSRHADQLSAVAVAIHPMASKEALVRVELAVLQSPALADNLPPDRSRCNVAECDQGLNSTASAVVQQHAAADVTPSAAKESTDQETPASDEVKAGISSKTAELSAPKKHLSAGAPCFTPRHQPLTAYAESGGTSSASCSSSVSKTPSGPQRRQTSSQLLATAPPFVPSSHQQQPELQDTLQDTLQGEAQHQPPTIQYQSATVSNTHTNCPSVFDSGAATYISAAVPPTQGVFPAAPNEVWHRNAPSPAEHYTQPIMSPCSSSSLAEAAAARVGSPLYLHSTDPRFTSASNVQGLLFTAASSSISGHSLPAAAVAAAHTAPCQISVYSNQAIGISNAHETAAAPWLATSTIRTSPMSHVASAVGAGATVVSPPPPPPPAATSDHGAAAFMVGGKSRRLLDIKPPPITCSTSRSTTPRTPAAAATPDHPLSASLSPAQLQAAMALSEPHAKRPLPIKDPVSKSLVNPERDTHPDSTSPTARNTQTAEPSSLANAASQVESLRTEQSGSPCASTAMTADTQPTSEAADVEEPAAPTAVQPIMQVSSTPAKGTADSADSELVVAEPASVETTAPQPPPSTHQAVQASTPPAALHWMSHTPPTAVDCTTQFIEDATTTLSQDALLTAGAAEAAVARETTGSKLDHAETARQEGQAALTAVDAAAAATDESNTILAGTAASATYSQSCPPSPATSITSVSAASPGSGLRFSKHKTPPSELPPAAAAALEAAVPAGLLPPDWQQYSSWSELELRVSFTAGGADVAALLQNRKRYREAKVLALSIASEKPAIVGTAPQAPGNRSADAQTGSAVEVAAQGDDQSAAVTDAPQASSGQVDKLAPVVSSPTAVVAVQADCGVMADVAANAAGSDVTPSSYHTAASEPDSDSVGGFDDHLDQSAYPAPPAATPVPAAQALQPADAAACEPPSLAAGVETPSLAPSPPSQAAAEPAATAQTPDVDPFAPGGDEWNNTLKQLLIRQGFSGKAADVKWRFILPVSEDRVGPFVPNQAVSWLLQGKSPKGINRQQATEVADQLAAVQLCGIISSDYNAQRLPGAKFFKPLGQLVPAVAAGLKYAAVTKADIAKGYPAATWNTLSNTEVDSSSQGLVNGSKPDDATAANVKAKTKHKKTGTSAAVVGDCDIGSSSAASALTPLAHDTSDACVSWEFGDIQPLPAAKAAHMMPTATSAPPPATQSPAPTSAATNRTDDISMQLLDIGQVSAAELERRFSDVMVAMLPSHKRFLESLSERALQLLSLADPADLQEVLSRPDAEQHLLKFLQQQLLLQEQRSSGSSWEAALEANSSSRRIVFYGPPVCAKCGNRGHAAAECCTSFCKPCDVWGHAEGECRDACERCGRVHERRDGVCSTFKCTRCDLFGHRISHCPRSFCSSCCCFGHTERHCMAFRTCDLCGELGHHQQHCPLVCSRCGYPGHSTANCMMKQCEQCEQFGHAAAECLHGSTAAGVAGLDRSGEVDSMRQKDTVPAMEQPWLSMSVADAAVSSVAQRPLAAGLKHGSAWDMPHDSTAFSAVANDEAFADSTHQKQNQQCEQEHRQEQQQVQKVDKRTVAPSQLLPEHARVFEQSLPPGLLPPAWKSYTSWAALERALGWANHPVPPSELKRRFREAKTLAQENTAAACEQGGQNRHSPYGTRSGSSNFDNDDQQQSPWDEEGLDSPTWGVSRLLPSAENSSGTAATSSGHALSVGGAGWNAALVDLLIRQGFSGKAADVKWRFILPVSEDRVGPFTSEQAVSWLLEGTLPKGINRDQAAELQLLAADQFAAVQVCGIISSDYNAQRLPGAKFFKPLGQLVPAVAADLKYAAVTKADIAKGCPAATWNTFSNGPSTSNIAQESPWPPQQQQHSRHRLARATSPTHSAFEIVPAAAEEDSSSISFASMLQVPHSSGYQGSQAAASTAARAAVDTQYPWSCGSVHSSATDAQSVITYEATAGASHVWPGGNNGAVLPDVSAVTAVMPAAVTKGAADIIDHPCTALYDGVSGKAVSAAMPSSGQLAGSAGTWTPLVAPPAASPPFAMPTAVGNAGYMAPSAGSGCAAAGGITGGPAVPTERVSARPPQLPVIPESGFQAPFGLPLSSLQLPVSPTFLAGTSPYHQQILGQPMQLHQVPRPPGIGMQQPPQVLRQTTQSAQAAWKGSTQLSAGDGSHGHEDDELEELLGLLGVTG